MDLDYSSMSRYVSPINPAVFPHLSIVLLGIGLFFTAWFFVYEVSIITIIIITFIVILLLLSPGHLQQVHPGVVQGAADRRGGLGVHGVRHPVPAALGGHLRLEGAVCRVV